MEWKKNNYLISDDNSLINKEIVYNLLSKTYWASSRPKHKIFSSIDNSLCFGLYNKNQQIGFARITSDFTIISWLSDLIIQNEYRGKGLGKWMMECIINHPKIKKTKIGLRTDDAHPFYEKYGFKICECMFTE